MTPFSLVSCLSDGEKRERQEEERRRKTSGDADDPGNFDRGQFGVGGDGWGKTSAALLPVLKRRRRRSLCFHT